MCTCVKEKHMGLLSYFKHPNQGISLINNTNHSTFHILQQQNTKKKKKKCRVCCRSISKWHIKDLEYRSKQRILLFGWSVILCCSVLLLYVFGWQGFWKETDSTSSCGKTHFFFLVNLICWLFRKMSWNTFIFCIL